MLVARSTDGGPLSAGEPLATAGPSVLADPAVAVDDRGATAAVWRSSADGTVTFTAAVAGPAESFGEPVALAPGESVVGRVGDRRPSVAFASPGRPVFAWALNGRARTARADESGITAPVTVARDAYGVRMSSLAAGGLVLAAASDPIAGLAADASGGFGPPAQLGRSREGGDGGTEAGGGGFVVYEAPNDRIAAVRLGERGSFGDAETVGSGSRPQVAGLPDGRAIAAWTAADTAESRVEVSVRARGALAGPGRGVEDDRPPGSTGSGGGAAPRVRLLTTRARLGPRGRIALRLRCTEPCRLRITGQLRVSGRARGTAVAVVRRLRGTAPRTVLLRLRPRAAAIARRALQRRQPVRLALHLSTGPAGASAPVRRAIRVTR